MMNVKLEDTSVDDVLTIEKDIFLRDETTTRDTGFDKNNKMSIKVEPHASKVHIQNKGQCFFEHLEIEVKDEEIINNYEIKMDDKISIKEEPLTSDAELQTEEYFECNTVGTEIKNDSNTENDFKDNIKFESGMQGNVSGVSSQNDKYFTLDLVKKIKKEAVSCIIRDEETTTEPDSESHSEAHHLPDILQATENEECVLSKNVMAEDISPSDSSRLNTEASKFNYNRSELTALLPNDGNNLSLTSNNFHKEHRPMKVDKRHKCSVCDLSYTHLSYLKTHKLIHEGKKTHKCDLCDRSFTRVGILKAHKFIHEGKKHYKCDVCDKSFIHVGSLKRHKFNHEGKKPHKCDVCHKSFTLQGVLKTHKLIHEGKKHHKCDVCDRSFTQVGSLKAHKLIHVGNKPHKCKICDKSFIRQADLKRHELIHGSKKPHKCDVCDKSFTRQADIKRHKLIHEIDKH